MLDPLAYSLILFRVYLVVLTICPSAAFNTTTWFTEAMQRYPKIWFQFLNTNEWFSWFCLKIHIMSTVFCASVVMLNDFLWFVLLLFAMSNTLYQSTWPCIKDVTWLFINKSIYIQWVQARFQRLAFFSI